MIDLLGILLVASFGEDVFSELVIYLTNSASRIMCILIIAHVLYFEFNNLCSVSFSSWGFVARFMNHVLVVTSSLHGWFINLSNYLVLLLHYSSYLHLNNWYLICLLLECSVGLFMGRGHKVDPLWPKANPLNTPYGSIQPICPFCQFASRWGQFCYDHLRSMSFVIIYFSLLYLINVSYRDLEITTVKICLFSIYILFSGSPLSLLCFVNVCFNLYALYSISIISVLVRGREQTSLIPKAIIPTNPMDH